MFLLPSRSLSSGSSAAGAPSAAPMVSADDQAPSHLVTHLQHGIHKPKSYTDGPVRWGMLAVPTAGELTSIDEALRDQKWIIAMDSEHSALLQNKIWHLVPPPKGKNINDCKWVYKTKRKADNTIDRYKARLVAKGYKQQL